MTTVRCLASAAAVAVALAAAPVPMAIPACAQIKWNLPTAYPADNFHSENLRAFAQDLVEVSGGKLAITVHPNASLFPANLLIGKVTAVPSAANPSASIIVTPAADLTSLQNVQVLTKVPGG